MAYVLVVIDYMHAKNIQFDKNELKIDPVFKPLMNLAACTYMSTALIILASYWNKKSESCLVCCIIHH